MLQVKVYPYFLFFFKLEVIRLLLFKVGDDDEYHFSRDFLLCTYKTNTSIFFRSNRAAIITLLFFCLFFFARQCRS